MESGIYTIENTVNRKLYVGYARNFKKRWKEHIWDLRAGKHHSYHLQQAWNQYGEKSFIFSILVECEEAFLCSEEHYWCNLLKVHEKEYGYNERPTDPRGECRRHSIETKEKIRQKRSEQVFPANYSETLSKARKRQKKPDSFKKKHSVRMIGNQYGKLIAKPVIQSTEDGKIVKEWNSLKEIVESLNISYSRLSVTCNGKGKIGNLLRGYVWNFKNVKQQI